jgi:hypothetical protein
MTKALAMAGPTIQPQQPQPSAPPPRAADASEQAYRIIAETSRYGHFDTAAIHGRVAAIRATDPVLAGQVEGVVLQQLTPVQRGEYARGGESAPLTVRSPLSATEPNACHGPPAAPDTGRSVADLTALAHANGDAAGARKWDPTNLLWFRDQVKNHGPWDYKQGGAGLQDFGNYNYGYAGSAMGVASDFLQRQAGIAQQAAGTSRPEWGSPGPFFGLIGGSAPYGDDPRDQTMMIQGMEDRRNGC